MLVYALRWAELFLFVFSIVTHFICITPSFILRLLFTFSFCMRVFFTVQFQFPIVCDSFAPLSPYPLLFTNSLQSAKPSD